MYVTTSFYINKLTLGELKDRLKQASKTINDSAEVSISVIQGDRPWESDVYSLEISGETK